MDSISVKREANCAFERKKKAEMARKATQKLYVHPRIYQGTKALKAIQNDTYGSKASDTKWKLDCSHLQAGSYLLGFG